MKKKFLVIMLGLLMVGFAFTGCSNGSDEAACESPLASVSFDAASGGDKVITIKHTVAAVDSLWWSYTATWKGGSGVTPVGAKATETEVQSGAGIGKISDFTPGLWSFNLYAYGSSSDRSNKTNCIYFGSSGDVTLNGGADNPISVSVDYTTGSTGTIALGTINFKGGSGTYTIDKITVDGTDKTTSLSDDKKLTGISVGEHTVYIRYKDADNYYGATCMVKVDSGVTTTISGQLDFKKEVPAAPVVTGVAPTTAGGSDGKITGLASTTKYEYSSNDGSSWSDVTDNSTAINGLTAGSYKVRVKETSKVPTGKEASVTVPARYAVTFDMQGHGTPVAQQAIVHGEKVTEPSAPTASGCIFEGWFKEAGCTNAWVFATDTVTATTTIYAKWVDSGSAGFVAGLPVGITLDYTSNGTVFPDFEAESVTIKTGDTAFTFEGATLDGKTLAGFYTDTACTNKVANANGTLVASVTDYTDSNGKWTKTTATTLYAKWNGAGVLTGSFSVSATKTVNFSKGNLYWDGSAYKFEANQYDIATSWNASHVSHFFWSKTESVARAETYPDGGATSSDVLFTNGTEETPNSGFTVNGETGKFRALSYSEWGYLVSTRTNAASLWGGATVCGVAGYVFMPDGWSGSGFTSGNSSGNSTNTYDADGWAEMEAAGAVFLPAAGYRIGTSVNSVGNYGFYWSSTAGDSDYAFYLYFDSSSSVGPADFGHRVHGHSVRLVCGEN